MTNTMNHEQSQVAADLISQEGCQTFDTHGFERVSNNNVRIKCWHAESAGKLCVGHSPDLAQESMSYCPLGINVELLQEIIQENGTDESVV